MGFDGQFKNYLKNIKNDDKIAILYHSDVDGLCSAVITSLALKKMNKRVVLFSNIRNKLPLFSEELMNEMKNKEINKIINVDFTADQDPESIKKAEEFADILILDHHKKLLDLNSEKTIFIKAQDYYDSPDYIPCSKLCFDIFSKIIKIDELIDIMLIGTIADSQYNNWKNQAVKIYPEMTEERFMGLIRKINCGMISEKYGMCIKLLEENIEFPKIEEEFLKMDFPVQKEIDYYVENWKKHSEIYNELNLVFLPIKSKFRIVGTIATIISYKHPYLIFLAYRQEDNIMAIDARGQDKSIALNDLLIDSIKGLDGATAGGHIPAAGARMKIQDFKKFKENIIKNLKKLRNIR